MDKDKRLFYNCMFLPAWLVSLPFFAAQPRKYRRGFRQKLGRLPAGLFPEKRKARIWVNAVSVGEVMEAGALIRELKRKIPEADIVLSTGTDTGQEAAGKFIGSDAKAVFYCPLDLPNVVASVIRTVKPDLFIACESEIWPNLLWRLKEEGAMTMLANGRFSEKSFGRYRLMKNFWKEVFGLFDRLMMVSEQERAKMLELGVPPGKLAVAGNLKFDCASRGPDPESVERMRVLLGLREGEDVFAAASLHPGEFGIAADVFSRLLEEFPRLIMIAAPRHPEKAGMLARVFSERRMGVYSRSSADAGKKRAGEKVIIIDTIGELLPVYGLSSVVFCGGSLVPKGGQNILEAAACGRVVLYGPHMDDFLQEKSILENSGSGHTVENSAQFLEAAGRLLADPARRNECGDRGRRAVVAASGASGRCASAAGELLARREEN